MCKKSFKTIHDLDKKRYKLVGDEYYSSCKICILDDTTFDVTLLDRLGFKNVKPVKEFGKIEDYEEFNIILVDIMGLGEEYAKEKGGVFFAEQIKERYPDKIVALYTSKSINEAKDLCDKYDFDIITKSGGGELLISKLKEYVRDTYAPYYALQRLNTELNGRQDLSFYEKAQVEDKFVRNIISGEKAAKLDFSDLSLQDKISIISNALSVAASLMTIFKK